MCSNTRSTQLGDDYSPMVDNIFQSRIFNTSDQIICTKGSFSCSTPNIYPIGIQDEYPGADTPEIFPEHIKR